MAVRVAWALSKVIEVVDKYVKPVGPAGRGPGVGAAGGVGRRVARFGVRACTGGPSPPGGLPWVRQPDWLGRASLPVLWSRAPARAVVRRRTRRCSRPGPHVGFSRVIVARRPRLLSWVVRRQQIRSARPTLNARRSEDRASSCGSSAVAAMAEPGVAADDGGTQVSRALTAHSAPPRLSWVVRRRRASGWR